jgi:hypothetical protein
MCVSDFVDDDFGIQMLMRLDVLGASQERFTIYGSYDLRSPAVTCDTNSGSAYWATGILIDLHSWHLINDMQLVIGWSTASGVTWRRGRLCANESESLLHDPYMSVNLR